MNGERVRMAREVCGITQFDLASRVGVVQSTIAQIEAGVCGASPEVIRAIALQTGFDISFFRRQNPLLLPEGSVLYRSGSSAKAKDKLRARRLVEFAFDMSRSISSKFKEIPIRLPRLDKCSAVEASRLTRSSLGLPPDQPVGNALAVAERAGVLVIELPTIQHIEGFSCWAEGDPERPVIAITGPSTSYRQQTTVSEELGHLVMHNPARGDVAHMEAEIKQFVGEFLFPESQARTLLRPPVTLAGLAAIKPAWGVSIQFLVYRALELRLISANQHRYLMSQIGARGWKQKEPGDDLPAEPPRVWRRMIEMLYGSPPNIRKVKADTGVSSRVFRALYYGKEEPLFGEVVQLKLA